MTDIEREDAELEAVREALGDTGIDPADFGSFVGRVIPGVIEAPPFDYAAATPVLLECLPRLRTPLAREIVARSLGHKAAKGVATGPLIEAFLAARADEESLKWAIASAIHDVVTEPDFDRVVELAADTRHGRARQMLIPMLWRVKSERAREVVLHSLDDEEVALHAMSALRRMVGNEEAREHIAPLADHPSALVARAARQTLRRIDKSRADARRP
jgi:muconolactone delta-isomerase